MKHTLSKLVISIIIFFSITLSAQAAEIYIFDPQHTYVLWHVNHFGFSNPSGKWMANGTVTLDKDHPQNSKVNVTIKMDDLTTGIPDLDKHLKAALFFNTAQYPIARFISKTITMTSDNAATVQGILTLHGVSKPISLEVKLNKSGISPVNNKMTAGFTATTAIKRSDFGMTSLLPGVGDDVKIDIEAEAAKK